ncbi:MULTISPECIES: hypothetical protein [unclassified Variovorax]|uniref:hypothetical protein n=1 Tax=unclassified Variovorax TaxID=663243 RepID=UPI000837E975|nr:MULTISPECIES: hypothetical protein [unclassified Variovorax]PNG59497.1 hypothetical protein CHC07_01224 [Variovorax sp. B4]PNG60712.1 hypothetical protein CHC06_00611 [Variovorax sp. B2]VTV13382.1 hypothetical protein WDL1CHR_04053 [Variovorax sp. WDL1]
MLDQVTGHSGRAAWIAAALLAALFAAFQIQSSLYSGALSLPVTYDDVGYFNDALARLEALHHDGGLAFIKGFWSNPPHAPLQTLLALIAFGVFGPHPWAADAMNAIPLTIILRLFLGFTIRALPMATATILTAALLAFPLLGLLIVEFRPDALCALLTAAGAMTIAADPRWRAGEQKTVAVASALFVGALLAKPTLAPVTVVVFGVAAAATAFIQTQSKEEALRVSRMAILSGAIAALVVLPYYAAVSQRLYEYITVNAFGSQAAVWAKNAATLDPAAYYLTGPGGKAAIGTPWLALSGALLVVSAPWWAQSWRVALSAAIAAGAAYAGVTAPSMKSPFIGLVVPAFVLCITAILAALFISKMPRWLGFAFALCMLIFALLTWRPVALRLWGTTVPTAQAQHFNRIHMQTVDVLEAIPNIGQRKLYFPVIAQYLNRDNLEFELRRRGLSPPSMPVSYMVGDIQGQKQMLADSDLAILFSDESTLPLPWPPSAGIRKDINAAVAAEGAFEEIGAVDAGPYLGRIVVLKRK